MDRTELPRRPLVAVFAVTRPDGRIHATPLWFHWDGLDLNLIVERGSRRHRRAHEARRAAVCIETTDGDDLAFVTTEGQVTVVDPLLRETRHRMWERYVGPERAHQAVEQGGHETKVLLLLRPETWIPAEG